MRNKNKQSPQWFINSIPDEISYILTCNTEVAFEDYETKYSELISQTENVDSYDDNTLSYGAQLGFWIPEEEDIKYLAYAGRYVNDYGEELGISMYTSLDEGSTVGLVSYDNCEGKLVDCGDGWYMIDETGSDYDGWKLSGYITADGNISMTMFYYNDYTGTYSFYCDFTMVEQYVS